MKALRMDRLNKIYEPLAFTHRIHRKENDNESFSWQANLVGKFRAISCVVSISMGDTMAEKSSFEEIAERYVEQMERKLHDGLIKEGINNLDKPQ